jgi:hypothetical protein
MGDIIHDNDSEIKKLEMNLNDYSRKEEEFNALLNKELDKTIDAFIERLQKCTSSDEIRRVTESTFDASIAERVMNILERASSIVDTGYDENYIKNIKLTLKNILLKKADRLRQIPKISTTTRVKKWWKPWTWFKSETSKTGGKKVKSKRYKSKYKKHFTLKIK